MNLKKKKNYRGKNNNRIYIKTFELILGENEPIQNKLYNYYSRFNKVPTW